MPLKCRLFCSLLKVEAPISGLGKRLCTSSSSEIKPTVARHFNSSQTKHCCKLPTPLQGQQNNAGVHQGDVLEHLGVSPKNTSRGEESRKAFPPEMGTYSNERSGNQVLEKQQLSCQGSNINHPRDTALSPFALIPKIPLRSKVKTCFLLLGGEYRCNISISSTSFKAIS